MGISIQVRGSYRQTEDYLRRMKKRAYFQVLEKYGQIGVQALKAATPEKSGATAESWSYEIIQKPGYYSIQWLNTHTEEPGHIPIAALIQYGHGTKQGAWIAGRDYINPAMRPIFDQIASALWKEVTR